MRMSHSGHLIIIRALIINKLDLLYSFLLDAIYLFYIGLFLNFIEKSTGGSVLGTFNPLCHLRKNLFK